MSQGMRINDRRLNFLLVVSTGAVFAAVAFASNLEKALASSITFGLLASIVSVKIERKQSRQFWAILALIAAIHVLLIAFIRFPEPRFGLMAVPFGLVDFLIVWAVLNWTEKSFPPEGTDNDIDRA